MTITFSKVIPIFKNYNPTLLKNDRTISPQSMKYKVYTHRKKSLGKYNDTCVFKIVFYVAKIINTKL